MTALDTNILVRVLTEDDPAQVEAARDLLGSDDSFHVPITVLLETGWVLEALYELDPTVVANGLRQFLGLPNVEIDRPNQVAQALHWYEEGMDFADAIHLAWSEDADRLATFDQSFAHDADGRSPCTVVSLPTD